MDEFLSELPPFKETRISGEFYGDLSIFAKYCGLSDPPGGSEALIQHGWALPHNFVDPLLALGRPIEHRRQPLLVSTREIEALCRSHGYTNTHAVGLPITYLPPTRVTRVRNSLLVMPVHTLPGMKPLFSIERYVSAIESLLPDFDRVAICVHRHCMRTGELPKAFRRLGVTIIEGSHTADVNALDRMVRLMSTFEYVTSNGVGSHLAYAAAFGARPSIWGPFAEPTPESMRRVWLYATYPHLLAKIGALTTEDTIRKLFGQLFVKHPKNAVQMIEWGRKEIGHDQIRPPKEMLHYLGWDATGRCRRRAKPIFKKMARRAKRIGARLSRVLPRPIKRKWLQSRLKRGDFLATQSWIRLYEHRTRRYELQTVPVLGRQFKVADVQSFIYCFEEIFTNRIYEFIAFREDPFIIDGGANVGLSTLFFKHLYPKSRIVAFEPDPSIFALLQQNCSTYELKDIFLRQKALWSSAATLRFMQEGADAGRIVHQCDTETEFTVEAERLSCWLDQPVDFLKLDIEGAEVEVIQEAGAKLRNAKYIFIEYHGFIEKKSQLGLLISTMENLGFRIHVHPGCLRSPRPFCNIEANGLGMDLLLHIFAIRED